MPATKSIRDAAVLGVGFLACADLACYRASMNEDCFYHLDQWLSTSSGYGPLTSQNQHFVSGRSYIIHLSSLHLGYQLENIILET